MSEGENGGGDTAADIVEEKSSRADTCRNTTSTVRDWKEGERPEGEEIIPETHAEPKSPKRSSPRQWSSDSPLITAEPEMLCSILSQEVSVRDKRKFYPYTQLKSKDLPFSHTTQDEFVLLACDGLFDVYSTEEVVDIVRAEMALDGDAQRTCEALTERAISKRYSRDNVSVVSPKRKTSYYPR